MIKKTFIILLLIGVFSLLILGNVIASPSGAASVSPGTSSSANPTNPDSADAYAGNITELTIFGGSTTQSWQGYSGNVTGTIQLANSDGKVMYNWSQLDPSGEIYSSLNDSGIEWSGIQCFNLTATGNFSGPGVEPAGNTSLYGMNSTQLDAAFGITSGDSDGIANTFASNNHDPFYSSSLEFESNECKSIKLFDSDGAGSFNEVLMYEPTSRAVVFTSILKSNADGFDGNQHDFEMLVLENGHSGNTDPTTYWFYMEIA